MIQETPLVSVLMLTYNHEPYIAQAIDSVLMQKTDFPYELIIGEDCSTDGTRAIVEKYAHTYPKIIRVITGPLNIGALANIIRINAAARGKYIATLEGDDFWNDELKLQKQADFLECNPEYGLVHSDVNHWHEEGSVLAEKYNATHGYAIPEGDIFIELLDPDSYLIKTPTALFRKDIHDRHVDYEVVRSHGWVVADLFNWLSMARFTMFKYFPEALATYRVGRETAGNTADFKKKIQIHRSVFAIRFYFMEKFPVAEAIRNKLQNCYVMTLLYDAFKIHDHSLAAEMRKYARANRMPPRLKRSLLYYGVGNRLLHRLLEPFI
jgi:glycosyltransferase involved in cell wall biosynthesis